MNRRRFLKAALGGVLAVALPIPIQVVGRLKNAGTGASVVVTQNPVWTPGIWYCLETPEFETFETKGYTISEVDLATKTVTFERR